MIIKMKKLKIIFLYVLLVSILYGCEELENNKLKQDEFDINYGDGIDIKVIVVDSCQYIWVKQGYGGGLSHKGNCKFCKEKSKNNRYDF